MAAPCVDVATWILSGWSAIWKLLLPNHHDGPETAFWGLVTVSGRVTRHSEKAAAERPERDQERERPFTQLRNRAGPSQPVKTDRRLVADFTFRSCSRDYADRGARKLRKNTVVNAAKDGVTLGSLSSGGLRVLPRAAQLPVTL